MNYTVLGLASKHDYDSYSGDCPYQQFIVNERFELPEELPDIKSVNQILLQPAVLEYRLVPQSARPKVLVSGLLRFQLLYTASASDSPEHTGTWEKRIDTFLELPYVGEPVQVCGVHLFVEYFTLELVHGRKFDISALIFAYAQF